MQKRILYQILPRLWNNSSHFTGKFSGIDAETLDYLSSLGVTDVWYTGIIRHATLCREDGCTPSDKAFVKGDAGSPYSITDYYDVNPYLADNHEERMSEFEDLIRRTHAAGMRVIIDFVPNHVSRDYSSHIKPSLGEGDDTSVHWAPGNDFFYYPGQPLVLPEGRFYPENPAKASGNCFSPHPGINDWYDTVKLNYCDFHTATWDKMYGILRFWAGKGVDGFRCDMVELVPPAFFQWVIRRIRQDFPDLTFIAEVYEPKQYRFYRDEVGFDLLYDKSLLYDTLRAITEGKAPASDITGVWQRLGDLQPTMLNFLENHDEQRIASDFFAGKAENGMAALAVSLLLNTAPFMLYFGQEAGERGMDDEPFSGINGRTSIFDWWKPEGIMELCRWIHTGEGMNPDRLAVLARYRELLRLVTERKAFGSEGKTYDLCYCQEEGEFDRNSLFAFLRGVGEEVFLIVSNFSEGDRTACIRIPSEAADFFPEAGLPDRITVEIKGKDYTLIGLSGETRRP